MTDKELFGNSEQLDCSDCVDHGGDWDCDHVQCRKGTDTISRAEAIKSVCKMLSNCFNASEEMIESVKITVGEMPSAQQDCDGCKWSDAIGYGECHHCKRAFEDMYEKGEQP